MLGMMVAVLLAVQAGAYERALQAEAAGDGTRAVSEARAAVAALPKSALPTETARARLLLGRLLAAEAPDEALPLLDAALPALPRGSLDHAYAASYRAIAQCGAAGIAKCVDALDIAAAELSAAPVPDADREHVAVLLSNAANLMQAGGRRPAADRLLGAALGRLEGAEPKTAFAAQAYANAAYQVTRISDYPRAIGYLDSSIAILTRLRGSAHADLVDPLSLLGEAYMRAGRYGEAGEVLRRAVAIGDGAANMPTVPHVLALTTLGGYYAQTGRRDLGLTLFERSLTLGEADPVVARQMAGVYRNVASIHVELRQWDKARALLDKALANAEGAAGKASSSYGGALMDIADLELKRGNLAAAERAASEARDVFAKAIEAKNPRNGDPLVVLGGVAARRGDMADAARLYDDALAAMAARAPSSLAVIDARLHAGAAWSRAEPATLRGQALARGAADALTTRLSAEAMLAGVGAPASDGQRDRYDTALAVAWDARGRALR